MWDAIEEPRGGPERAFGKAADTLRCIDCATRCSRTVHRESFSISAKSLAYSCTHPSVSRGQGASDAAEDTSGVCLKADSWHRISASPPPNRACSPLLGSRSDMLHASTAFETWS